jgi:Ca2+-binding RTX toxin-like protein
MYGDFGPPPEIGDYDPCGEEGDDILIGGAGVDVLSGEGGNDYLDGSFGNGQSDGSADWLDGGSDSDTLVQYWKQLGTSWVPEDNLWNVVAEDTVRHFFQRRR